MAHVLHRIIITCLGEGVLMVEAHLRVAVRYAREMKAFALRRARIIYCLPESYRKKFITINFFKNRMYLFY